MNEPKHKFARPTLDQQCEAMAKHTNQQCTNFKMQGSNFCRFHGGASIKNQVKHMISQLKSSGGTLYDLVQQNKNNPDLLNLSADITAMQIIRDKCMEQIEHDKITDIDVRRTVNFLAQSIAILAKTQSIIDKNKSEHLDIIQIYAYMDQIKISVVNALKSANLTPEQTQIICQSIDESFKNIPAMQYQYNNQNPQNETT
jgi:hypothetical protein